MQSYTACAPLVGALSDPERERKIMAAAADAFCILYTHDDDESLCVLWFRAQRAVSWWKINAIFLHNTPFNVCCTETVSQVRRLNVNRPEICGYYTILSMQKLGIAIATMSKSIWFFVGIHIADLLSQQNMMSKAILCGKLSLKNYRLCWRWDIEKQISVWPYLMRGKGAVYTVEIESRQII